MRPDRDDARLAVLPRRCVRRYRPTERLFAVHLMVVRFDRQKGAGAGMQGEGRQWRRHCLWTAPKILYALRAEAEGA
jgi:hypothetical protein